MPSTLSSRERMSIDVGVKTTSAGASLSRTLLGELGPVSFARGRASGSSSYCESSASSGVSKSSSGGAITGAGAGGSDAV
jgi:hypothetical protein